MDLLWPEILFLWGLVPLIIAVYAWILHRRRRFTVRYSSLMLVREARPGQTLVRRFLPFALFLLALTSLVFAAGRPVSVFTIPTSQRTVILALDVSRSMCATDILPNRLEAAKSAARSFIENQPASTQIGIVGFAGFAVILQSPTTDQELLMDAIENLAPARRTAVGSAILTSIDAIAEIEESVAPSVNDSTDTVPVPVPAGAFAPAIIVLLTDGASNAGPHPLLAAQQAVDRGIQVYTIGFGTVNNDTRPNCYPQSPQSPDSFGGGQQQFGNDPFFGGGGGGFRRGIDEETLKGVAELTGATYYSAESSDELNQIYQNLPTHLITRHETMEISFVFTAIGALLAGLAIVLSLLWHPVF